MRSWLARARLVSGLTRAECARAIEKSENDFMDRENNPGMLSLNELRALRAAFNNEARLIMWEALEDLKP